MWWLFRTVLVDDKELHSETEPPCFPYRGRWASKAEDWREIYLAVRGTALTADLSAGRHTVTLRKEAKGGVNLDWIRLVPLQH